MKIFIALQERFAGCGFYRLYQPHNRLGKTKKLDVLISPGLENNGGWVPMDFDLAIFHKGYFCFKTIAKLKSLGIPVIVDFDDWWRLDTEHVFYKDYLQDDSSDKMVRLAREADYLTCTTERLAIELRRVNPNVTVIPNAWDSDYPQCEPKRAKESKLIFGYLGGHCHSKDVVQLHGVNNRLSSEFSNYKFRLMGVDGSEVYNQYSMVMSDNGALAPSHFDWIEKADIWHYPQFYNHLDVSLVPLVNNKFNSLKSELKLIEAGFMKKAVVVDNVHPYRDMIKHKHNAMVVNKYGDWYKNIKYLIKNPQAVIDLGEALHETVQGYDIDIVNEKRYNFYKDVLKKRNTNSSERGGRVQAIHE